MSFQIAALHLNIWSRHCVKMGLWVFEFLDPEHFMTDCDTSFPWRCMSERYSINIRATTKCGTQIAAFYLNSWLSYSDKMTHWVFGFLLTWRGHDRLWKVVTLVSHLHVSLKLFHYQESNHPNALPKLQHYITLFGLDMVPKWRTGYLGFLIQVALWQVVTQVSPCRCKSERYYIIIRTTHPNMLLKLQH